MEYDFGARAKLTARQCLVSYMYDFDKYVIDKKELRQWALHLSRYFDEREMQVYVQCSEQDIEQIAKSPRSPFVDKGHAIALRENVNPEHLYAAILADVDGSILPDLYSARSLYKSRDVEAV